MAQSSTRPSLSTRRIVFLVIAAAAPMAAMVGNVPLAVIYGNGAGIRAAYVIATAILLCFSVGYAAMSRRVINTGAFYTYIGRALGKPAGVAAAYVAVLSYGGMTFGLAGAGLPRWYRRSAPPPEYRVDRGPCVHFRGRSQPMVNADCAPHRRRVLSAVRCRGFDSVHVVFPVQVLGRVGRWPTGMQTASCPSQSGPPPRHSPRRRLPTKPRSALELVRERQR